MSEKALRQDFAPPIKMSSLDKKELGLEGVEEERIQAELVGPDQIGSLNHSSD